MAKATAWCTCSKCGHQFKVEKTCSNRRDADSFEAWATNHYDECPDCYRERNSAEREAQKTADNAAAAAYTEANQLPALTGSEKLAAWANTIRHKRLAYLDKSMAGGEPKPEYYDYRAWLITHTSAKYWIDNRDNSDEAFHRIGIREWKAQ